MAPLPALVLSLLLLLQAASPASGELNVWFERGMLESVLSQMLMLRAKNPLRPRCKPRANVEQLRSRFTTDRYPIVADGHLLSGLYFDSLSRSGVVLAYDLSSFTVHWATASRFEGVPPERVQYRFLDLRSHNETLLHPPQLDIPTEGFVPTTESSFQLSLACTNASSGVAEFDIHALFQWPNSPARPALTMRHRFRKACLSMADLVELQHKCHCRKKCEARIRRIRQRRRKNRQRKKRRQPKTTQSRSVFKRRGRRRGDRQGRRADRGPASQQRRHRRRRRRQRERRRKRRRRRKRCQAKCRQTCREHPTRCSGGGGGGGGGGGDGKESVGSS